MREFVARIKDMLHICICPRDCDCFSPDSGLMSNFCPEHNTIPYRVPECTAKRHRNGALNVRL
jgi:hypothetical protein